MDKLKMEARPMDEVLKKVAAICPAAVQDNKIDFERLKQELAPELDDSAESYNFTWVGKRDAIMGAATPIRKTLLPCKAESKNWDTTKNLYIEGDNLDALKLLQESYLGKVKVCYIDPPYNTGNDFVYCDDFAENCAEYMEKKGQCDVETNERLFKNDESNGRFHSNWCSMIYPRLKVARDLLSDDGVIFISIDDNEIANLRKICDEVFGEENFIGQIVWHKKDNASFLSKNIVNLKEYILLYCKSSSMFAGTEDKEIDTTKHRELITKPSSVQSRVFPKDSVLIENGGFSGVLRAGCYGNPQFSMEILKDVNIVDGRPQEDIQIKGRFCWSQTTIDEEIANGGQIEIKSISGMKPIFYKNFGEDIPYRPMTDLLSKIIDDRIKTNQDADRTIKGLFDNVSVFDYTKPFELIKLFVGSVSRHSKNAIILDFFSGSGTTAHAVMDLNAEDGGNRRFIMVQLPENLDENLKHATGQAQATIEHAIALCDELEKPHLLTEVAKERIRRAGDKVVEETGKLDLDIGFKVLKLADSNMKDVYYNPADITQAGLLDKVDNIKKGRTELDLLYGVMLDLGLMLDLDVAEVKSGKTTYYNVDNGSLIACFSDNIPESIIKEIACLKPFRVVFKDSSFADAPAKINVTEIFKTMSPNTKITVL